jgi:protein MpaA
MRSDVERGAESVPGHRVERLGKNINGYLGERIDIQAVLRDTEQTGQNHGWRIESFLESEQIRLFALRRLAAYSLAAEPAFRVYLSAGIHGDEPAGPLAVRQLIQENNWPPEAEIYVCPCLNPSGFLLNRRENAEGTDLNRQYLEPKAQETVAHIAWLKPLPAFDLCLCLHEDWESHGFYVYELNPDQQPSLAERMVAEVAKVCPIDSSEIIEGRPAEKGIIRPSVDPRTRPQWPEAFFLLANKTRLSYTMEAPSDFPLPARTAALVAAVRAALENFRKRAP